MTIRRTRRAPLLTGSEEWFAERFREWTTAAGVKDPKATARALVVPFDGAVAGSEVDGPQRASDARRMAAWDSQSGASAATLVACGTVPTIVPERRQNSAPEPTPANSLEPGNRKEGRIYEENRGWSRGQFPSSKPPYAALWKSSIRRIQLVSGFHLGKIWATNLRSRMANRSESYGWQAKVTSLRLRPVSVRRIGNHA